MKKSLGDVTTYILSLGALHGINFLWKKNAKRRDNLHIMFMVASNIYRVARGVTT